MIPGLFELLIQLEGAPEVSEAGEGCRAAERNQIRLTPLLPQSFTFLFHQRCQEPVIVVGDLLEVNFGSQQAADQQVARVLAALIDGAQSHRIETCLAASRGRQANMIRLRTTSGDDGVGTLPERVGEQVFQLPRLIAPKCQAGHVISLEVDPGPAEALAEVRGKLERSGKGGQRKAGKVRVQVI